MTTHHPKFSVHTALQLVGLTTKELPPTALDSAAAIQFNAGKMKIDWSVLNVKHFPAPI